VRPNPEVHRTAAAESNCSDHVTVPPRPVTSMFGRLQEMATSPRGGIGGSGLAVL
jgi:hypothetical protein